MVRGPCGVHDKRRQRDSALPPSCVAAGGPPERARTYPPATIALSFELAVNFGAFDGGTTTDSPVRGLRAMR